MNGSFSNATPFSGWTQLGSPTIDTSNLPSDASYAALIQSTNSVATSPFGNPGPVTSGAADTITDINSVLGTSIIGGGTANSGEGIYQTFNLALPETITFEASFASYDSSPQDSAGYVLNGTYHQLYTTPFFTDTTPSAYPSTPISISAPAGPNTLAFVVYNTSDNTFDTEMWVTDVEVTPEPSTWLLVTAGLVGLVAVRRLTRRETVPAVVSNPGRV